MPNLPGNCGSFSYLRGRKTVVDGLWLDAILPPMRPFFTAILLLMMHAFGTAQAQTVDPLPDVQVEGFTDSRRDRAARQHYLTGREAYEGGRYQEAIREFEQALDGSLLAELNYFLGRAYEAAGENRNAITAYERFLEGYPSDTLESDTVSRLARLRGAVSGPAPVVTHVAPQPAVVVLPTPAQTARMTVIQGPVRRPDVTEEFWFWALIFGTAVVVGGGIAVGVHVASSNPSIATPPEQGNVPGVGIWWVDP